MINRLVTGASGRRDDYQIPIALAEAGLLQRHVTDQYLPDALLPLLPVLGDLGEKLSRRHRSGLLSVQVHCSRRLAMQQLLSRLLPPLRSRLQGDQDPLSWSALRQAQQHDAALLLYAGYGYRAFMAEPYQARRRGLVQYHPHICDSAAILRADSAQFPFLSDALEQLRRDEEDPTNQSELEIADLVICNSTFTANTCLSLGIELPKIRVIPYGIDPLPPPAADPTAAAASHCRFLFVGTGIQRKGLHHLLLAWKRAGLRRSRLTIVSRWIDPQILSHIDLDESVEILQSVDNQALEALYRACDVFVLPSLIEGFGYVYLEAMARGCFCIGTTNTGLPDIVTPESGRVLPAGHLKQLAQTLQETEALWADGQLERERIAAVATARPWQQFRQDVVLAVRELLLKG